MPIAAGEQQCSQSLGPVGAPGLTAASAMLRSVCWRCSVVCDNDTDHLHVKSA